MFVAQLPVEVIARDVQQYLPRTIREKGLVPERLAGSGVEHGDLYAVGVHAHESRVDDARGPVRPAGASCRSSSRAGRALGRAGPRRTAVRSSLRTPCRREQTRATCWRRRPITHRHAPDPESPMNLSHFSSLRASVDVIDACFWRGASPSGRILRLFLAGSASERRAAAHNALEGLRPVACAVRRGSSTLR